MKHLAKSSWFFSLLFAASLKAATCGSEGPHPFMALTENPPVKQISSIGGVEEFIYWENSNTIMYRNERDELRGVNRITDQDTLYATTSFEVSRVTDPQERYVLSHEDNWIFDTNNQSAWQEFRTDAPHLFHEFWNNGKLFSIDIDPLMFGGQNLGVYRLDLDDPDFESKRVCNATIPFNSGFRLAEGSQHPYLFLYRVKFFLFSEWVEFYRLDVTNCRLTQMGSTENIPGRVKRVVRFDSINATAVQFDHPKMSLRWQQGAQCRYHTLDNKELMIPSYRFPVMVQWNPKVGIEVTNLAQQRKVGIQRADISDIDTRDLWIPIRGKELLISPVNQNNQRHLLHVDLSNLIPK